jgi:nucleoside-diphosphate-sugar epimerase
VKIFIAGGSGVIGRRVIPILREAGHEVTGLSRSQQSDSILEWTGAHPIRASLTSPDELRDAVRGHDVVINLATSVPPASRVLFAGAWKKMDEIRRTGSADLVAASAAGGVRRFIQESFAPIYADQADRWIDESSRVEPAAFNRSVLDAERNAQSFRGPWVVLRFAYFYGEDSEFTQQMMSMVRHGWAASFGRPEGFFSSISHDDAASAVFAAINAPPGIYNVVDDEPLTRRELNDSLADALGVRHPRFLPAWITKWTGSVGETLARSQRISNRKLRASSNWSPKNSSVRHGWRTLVSKS